MFQYPEKDHGELFLEEASGEEIEFDQYTGRSAVPDNVFYVDPTPMTSHARTAHNFYAHIDQLLSRSHPLRPSGSRQGAGFFFFSRWKIPLSICTIFLGVLLVVISLSTAVRTYRAAKSFDCYATSTWSYKRLVHHTHASQKYTPNDFISEEATVKPLENINVQPAVATFFRFLTIHKVGVLEASNGASLRPGSCIMDPAGRTYMLNGLGGAGGASGAIYAYFGLTTVADAVQQAFRTFAGTAGFAKMHMYTQTELGKHKEMAPVGIIHTVGPNGSQVPDFNTFKDILIDAYMYALKEYFSHGDQCTELRMLPVSMGIFAHSDIRGNAKKQAKVTIECLARALERVLTDTPTLNEMITRNPIGLFLLGGTGFTEYLQEIQWVQSNGIPGAGPSPSLKPSSTSDSSGTFQVASDLPSVYRNVTPSQNAQQKMKEIFVPAFRQMYAQALQELKNGKKMGHWIWYFIPTPPYYVNNREVGSDQNKRCALRGLDETLAYLIYIMVGSLSGRTAYMKLIHAILEHAQNNIPVLNILGPVDTPKLRSSVKHFRSAATTVGDTELQLQCAEMLHELQ